MDSAKDASTPPTSAVLSTLAVARSPPILRSLVTPELTDRMEKLLNFSHRLRKVRRSSTQIWDENTLLANHPTKILRLVGVPYSTIPWQCSLLSFPRTLAAFSSLPETALAGDELDKSELDRLDLPDSPCDGIEGTDIYWLYEAAFLQEHSQIVA